MPEFLTEYTHVDGTKWVGPTFHADSLLEAQANAMDYPVQPLVVIGELVDTVVEDLTVRRVVKVS